MDVDLPCPEVPHAGSAGDPSGDRHLRVIPGGQPAPGPGGEPPSRHPRPFSLKDASSSLQTRPLSLLIVDDHTMFRQALASVIAQIAPHAVITDASSCAEAIELLGTGCPFSIILLDLAFQAGPTGLLAIDVLRQRCAATPIAVISGHDDADMVMGAIDRGAMGFIPKTSSVEVLLHAMALVLAGQPYFPIDAVRHVLPPPRGAGPQDRGAGGRATWHLTPREQEIVERILEGKANKVIAAELGIQNEDTVRKHVSSILRKAAVRTRTQLVLKIVATEYEPRRG